MSYFALPFAASSTATHSKPFSFYRTVSRRKSKRKRAASSSSSSSCVSVSSGSSNDDDHNDTGQTRKDSTNDLLTNPLSLSPNEIFQYKIAGLALNESLPSVPEWPHRGFPESVRLSPRHQKQSEPSGDEREKGTSRRQDPHAKSSPNSQAQRVETEGSGRAPQGHELHVHHIHVLTTILHKCLLARDITRARRAWGLLIRTQISGQGFDFKASGYWGIGAELLIRSLSASQSTLASIDCDKDSDNASETSHRERSSRTSSSTTNAPTRRGWNIKEGMERAADYYERLIVSYPFKRQFSNNVSALTWWPIMIACEIYGIQHKQREALRKLENDKIFDRSEPNQCENMYEYDQMENYISGEDSDSDQMRAEEQRLKKQEYFWQAENQIRLVTLEAAEMIRVRLDERMTIPPYSESRNMLRLRGMLGLYISDLSVPPFWEASQAYTLKINPNKFNDNRQVQRSLLWREREINYKNSLRKREQEIKMANEFFAKLVRYGGEVETILDMEDGEDGEDRQDGAYL
ncbi:hypothetical protein GcM3_043005 [Golovinomyces cichoracearum]|uniref:Uncharacterized protein n=1 Tax=Golovinomyces cichoracearum TaxID=62708 RepID=A0A420J1K8_9PEZI|nr:hypothetical protein GcM3_043005 [Golovinomyces cichoracearum]